MSQKIKGPDKKIVQKETQEALDCNCRVKTDCLLDGNCRKKRVIYKCIATTCDSKKGLTKGEFKKKSCNDHVKSFRNEFYDTSTTEKTKFSIKDFFSKCDEIHADLVTFTEEILNGKLQFFCSVIFQVM